MALRLVEVDLLVFTSSTRNDHVASRRKWHFNSIEYGIIHFEAKFNPKVPPY